MNKSTLRSRMRRQLRAMTAQARATASAAICQRLAQLHARMTVTAVAAYWPIVGEPDLRPFLLDLQAAGIPLFLPRWNPLTDVYEMAQAQGLPAANGPHGAPEPPPQAPALTPDVGAQTLWLVPGLAFDPAGNRLGRGGGFYDRLLANLDAPRIGIAFHSQLLPHVPTELHDIRMHAVASNRGAFSCASPHKEHTQWNILSALPDLSSAFSDASSYKKQPPQALSPPPAKPPTRPRKPPLKA